MLGVGGSFHAGEGKAGLGEDQSKLMPNMF